MIMKSAGYAVVFLLAAAGCGGASEQVRHTDERFAAANVERAERADPRALDAARRAHARSMDADSADDPAAAGDWRTIARLWLTAAELQAETVDAEHDTSRATLAAADVELQAAVVEREERLLAAELRREATAAEVRATAARARALAEASEHRRGELRGTNGEVAPLAQAMLELARANLAAIVAAAGPERDVSVVRTAIDEAQRATNDPRALDIAYRALRAAERLHARVARERGRP